MRTGFSSGSLLRNGPRMKGTWCWRRKMSLPRAMDPQKAKVLKVLNFVGRMFFVSFL